MTTPPLPAPSDKSNPPRRPASWDHLAQTRIREALASGQLDVEVNVAAWQAARDSGAGGDSKPAA